MDSSLADKLSSGVFISEILADNAGGSAVDVDGDGRANKADEFIEIQNTSGNTISLDGYEIWSDKGGLLYAFEDGETLASGDTATVLGEYTGPPPAGFYGAGTNNSVNWLPDGEGQKFETIYLVDTISGEFVALSYGNPPRAPTPPSGFPSGVTQVGSGESIDSNAPNGSAFARDGNGTLVETTPTPGTPDIPCFFAGTRISTPFGPRRVDALRPGDLVNSRDHGLVPIQAISVSHLSTRDLVLNPELRPVLFARGAVGNARPMALSAQHRVLVCDDAAQLLFGDRETLVAARHFIGREGVELCDTLAPVTYIHLLFERHEVIKSDGCWTESLFLGDVADRLIREPQNWLAAQGLNLRTMHHTHTARPVLRQFEAKLLLGPRRSQLQKHG